MKNHEQLSVLIDENTISDKVKELGIKITEDYKNKDLVTISILKGSIVFTADIIRQIDLPIEISFMSVSSYGDSTESSKVVNIKMDVDIDIKNKDVLIIEDIVDTGVTLSYLKEYFIHEKKVKSFKICSLLDKPSRRLKNIKPDYCGFEIEDYFVVGYGLDIANKYRNLKNVCKIDV